MLFNGLVTFAMHNHVYRHFRLQIEIEHSSSSHKTTATQRKARTVMLQRCTSALKAWPAVQLLHVVLPYSYLSMFICSPATPNHWSTLSYNITHGFAFQASKTYQ